MYKVRKSMKNGDDHSTATYSKRFLRCCSFIQTVLKMSNIHAKCRYTVT